MAIKAIEKKIYKTKEKMMKIQEMRPGSISKQYNVCGMQGCKCKDPVNPKKHGPYFNLSFTTKGKGGTKFIRPIFAKQILKETNEYRKFKKLSELWITLSIELSNMKMEVEKAKIDTKNKIIK